MTDCIPYSQVRELIHDGDLLAFAGAWPISFAIRWWTNQEPGWRAWASLAPISHVGLAVWQDYRGTSRLCCLESVGGGPRMVPLSSCLRMYCSAGGHVYVQQATHMHGHKVVEAALDLWGRGLVYPTRQYLAFLSGAYRWLRGTDVDPDGVVCSEFVAAALKMVHLWEGEPAMASPLDVSGSGLFEPRVEIVP